MKRPSFQFYPADWRNNAKLRRCSEAARGAWMDVLCVLHDSDEYGVCRWPLADLARASGVPLKLIRELADKDVLKGSDKEAAPYIYTPRHAGKDGDPVALVESNGGPCWYCSRFVRDEWVRQRRGQSTRFDEDKQPPKRAPNPQPKETPMSPPKVDIGESALDSHQEEKPKNFGEKTSDDAQHKKYTSNTANPHETSKGDSPKVGIGERQGDGYTSTSSTTLNTKTLKALSGKPNAIAVLDYLNERTGRSYQAVDSNTKLIAGRLNEGATVEQCKAVIDAKVAKWGADPKMDEYLRPKTLFNATNYAQYAGELGAQKIVANSSGNDRQADPRFRGCK
jgi:uncharacterized phage protein (TIGR02220 family)